MAYKASNSAAYGMKINMNIPNIPGSFMRIAKVIADANATIDIVEMLSDNGPYKKRCVHVNCSSIEHEKEVIHVLHQLEGVQIEEVIDKTIEYHLHGKMEIHGFSPLKNKSDLSIAYTPGVARPCKIIAADKEQANNLTCKGNTVAIVTDGTAVLGLGDIGPEAALPVMEGKCLLFKEFAGVDAIPICVDTKDPEEIVKLVKQISPTFGGINLEDISAPHCFEIEEKLKAELKIPVFHDDQHGTAIVALAALYNALKVTDKKIGEIKAVVCGLGSAGTACAKMFYNAGLKNIIGVDKHGAINSDTECNGNPGFEWFKHNTNPDNVAGKLDEVIKGADVFLGVSAPGILSLEAVKSMNQEAIIFAMANPIPEIMPELAAEHVAVMATGRSDYPNQINNVLAFPGLFRGALDCRATAITESMKLAAAQAIADIVGDNLATNYIIPSPLDPTVAEKVARAVKQQAINEGIGRLHPCPAPTFNTLEF